LKECRRIILAYHTPPPEGDVHCGVSFAELCRATRRELILIEFIERDLELCDSYGVTRPLKVASLLVDTTYFPAVQLTNCGPED
jgi:hypothetical protein